MRKKALHSLFPGAFDVYKVSARTTMINPISRKEFFAADFAGEFEFSKFFWKRKLEGELVVMVSVVELRVQIGTAVMYPELTFST